MIEAIVLCIYGCGPKIAHLLHSAPHKPHLSQQASYATVVNSEQSVVFSAVILFNLFYYHEHVVFMVLGPSHYSTLNIEALELYLWTMLDCRTTSQPMAFLVVNKEQVWSTICYKQCKVVHAMQFGYSFGAVQNVLHCCVLTFTTVHFCHWH